eukprot:TRINITY_DN31154_c0_g1_i1.p1 TRINITY_DN31154_c0_g1~~TRINITY_DN31154_c0_g1_i1.p1  ORF type:complete len:331 (+),score=62.42 TRINITY_DN31154_c0_g1_i1:187-1179(+)
MEKEVLNHDPNSEKLILVARKRAFGLPTSCPDCLNVYICLKLAQIPFQLDYNSINPDTEALPSIEYGEFAAFENESNNIIDILIEKGIVDIDSRIPTHIKPNWIAYKSMILSALRDVVLYELWIASCDTVVNEIYFSDLPWPINRILRWKQKRTIMQRLGVDSTNVDSKRDQFYRNADKGYEALSEVLGDQPYFLANEPTTIDAILVGHILFVLHAFDDSSVLKQLLKKHESLSNYAENIKSTFLEASSSSDVQKSFSAFSKMSRKDSRHKGNKEKPKREKTEEEKNFKRRSKYFLITQFVTVIVFLALMGNLTESEFEMEDEDGLISDD